MQLQGSEVGLLPLLIYFETQEHGKPEFNEED